MDRDDRRVPELGADGSARGGRGGMTNGLECCLEVWCGATRLDEFDVLLKAELVDLAAHKGATIRLVCEEEDGDWMLGGGGRGSCEETRGPQLADHRSHGVKGCGTGHVVHQDESVELFAPEGLWTCKTIGRVDAIDLDASPGNLDARRGGAGRGGLERRHLLVVFCVLCLVVEDEHLLERGLSDAMLSDKRHVQEHSPCCFSLAACCLLLAVRGRRAGRAWPRRGGGAE